MRQYDIDEYDRFPLMMTSRELSQLSRSRRLSEFIFAPAWPLSPRKVVLDASAIDWTENNSVFIHIKSIEHHPFVYTINHDPRHEIRYTEVDVQPVAACG